MNDPLPLQSSEDLVEIKQIFSEICRKNVELASLSMTDSRVAVLRTKLAQMENSLFGNVSKHTVIEPSEWIPEVPEPVMVPIDEDLEETVNTLQEQVSDLATNVRQYRNEVVSSIQVTNFSEQLGGDDFDMMKMDDGNDDRGRFGAQNGSDMVTRDMLKRLKTNVDKMVTTTTTLRDDVPRCLDASKKELRAATQALRDSSNVDQAMMGKPAYLSSSSSSLDPLASTPKSAIRGLLAADHVKRF